jgi:hypothetical protein
VGENRQAANLARARCRHCGDVIYLDQQTWRGLATGYGLCPEAVTASTLHEPEHLRVPHAAPRNVVYDGPADIQPPRHVREMRLVPVPTIPEAETWNAHNRAQTARVLSHQLAEMLSLYGSAVTLEALALALRADMQTAAEAIGAPKLAAMYDAAATMVRGMATELERAEMERR